MKGITRILQKTFREFCALRKNYGFRLAFYNLVWWINFYIPTPLRFKMSRWALLRKTKWLDKYISTKYGEIISRYAVGYESGSIIQNPKIWVFWGQGEEKMPPLIKACRNQLISHNNNIVLITNENIRQYIQISPVIIDKVTSGQITWAHFSDLVRMSLLSKYGGLWIDATGWVPDAIPFRELMSRPIYSPNGTVENGNRNICFWTSLGVNWSGWCLWANHTRNRVFSFVRDMLSALIENESMTIDYVLIDYLIYYAVHHFDGVKEEFATFSSLPCNNRGKLASLMNSPFDEETYRQLCRDDFVFKLSFRSPWKPRTPDGKLTFYGKLICDK